MLNVIIIEWIAPQPIVLVSGMESCSILKLGLFVLS